MAAWCLAHPWMTFIVAILLATRSFRFVYRRKCCKHAPEPVGPRDPVGGHSAGCPSFDALPKPCTCKAGE